MEDQLMMIACDRINCDQKNNVSRQDLTPVQCADLAASIQEHGLEQPIVVSPDTSVEDYDYRVVLGNRRFVAIAINLGRPEIQCIIRHYEQEEGLVANVVENLLRLDITYWEQCCALKQAFPAHAQVKDLCRSLSKSDSWVRVRWLMWTLAKSIRDGVEAGLYGPAEIGVLLKQDPAERTKAATKIRKGKAAGQSMKEMSRSMIGNKGHRSKKDVKRMMTKCMEMDKLDAVHALRFACGEISDTLLLELLE